LHRAVEDFASTLGSISFTVAHCSSVHEPLLWDFVR
jgi:hypothetical protein